MFLIFKSSLSNDFWVKYIPKLNIGNDSIFKVCDICNISSDSFYVVTSLITQVKQLVLSNLKIPNYQTILNHWSYQDTPDHDTWKKIATKLVREKFELDVTMILYR